MEEDIEIIKKHYVFTTNHVLDDENKKFKQAIENLINKHKEQEKMIELMADYIDLYGECVDSSKKPCEKAHCKECIIEFFRKKAKGE